MGRGIDPEMEKRYQFEGIQGFVTLIDPQGRAHVRDNLGNQHLLPIRLVSGRKPRVGETWLLTQKMSNWTFERVLRAVPFTLTGNRQDGTALANLIDMLIADGDLIDETTTGGGGGGGGGGAGKRPATVVIGCEAAGHLAEEVDFLAETGNVKAALDAGYAAAIADGAAVASILILPGQYVLEDEDDPLQWISSISLRIFGQGFATIVANSSGPVIEYNSLTVEGLTVYNQGSGGVYRGTPGPYGFSSLGLTGYSLAYAFGAGTAIDAAPFADPSGGYVEMRDSSQALSGGGHGITNCTQVFMRSGAQALGYQRGVVAVPGMALDLRISGVDTTLFSNIGELAYSTSTLSLIMRDNAAIQQLGTTDAVSALYGGSLWVDIEEGTVSTFAGMGQPETDVMGSSLGIFGGSIRNSVLSTSWGLGMLSGVSSYTTGKVGFSGNRATRAKVDCSAPYLACESPEQEITDNRFQDGVGGGPSSSTTVDVQAAGGGMLIARNRFRDSGGRTSIKVRSGAVGTILRGNTGTDVGGLPTTSDSGTGTVID